MSFGFFTSSGAVSAGRRGLTGYFVWVFLGGFGFFFGFFFVVQISFPSSKTSELGSPEKKKGDYLGLDLGEKPGILIPGTTRNRAQLRDRRIPATNRENWGKQRNLEKEKIKNSGISSTGTSQDFPSSRSTTGILNPASPSHSRKDQTHPQIHPNSPKFAQIH